MGLHRHLSLFHSGIFSVAVTSGGTEDYSSRHTSDGCATAIVVRLPGASDA